MGRKKKKALKPWCWYCNREFDEEKVLIYHQKAKHFKCHICGKKLYTGPGLSIHCSQVHQRSVTAIANALPHRSDPDVEIYGTEGIPFLDVMARARQKKVDIVVKDKNIANAALPAKYERTLDTPYGVVVERAVKPGSPSIVAPNAQPILKSYYTPASGDGDSCTPGDASNHLRDVSNDVMTPKQNEIPVQVIANKIQAPPGRCRIYHPSQDISLEEHRLRFPKYSKYDPDNKPQQPPYPLVQPSYPPTQPSAYPIYPQAYYQPPIPPYPYPYPQPSYAPIPPGIQFLIIEYRMPQPFPPTTFQMNNQQFPNHQTGYYK